MKIHPLIVVSALAMGFAAPVMAQSSTTHRYVTFYKYADNAVKAMTENPQDRAAPSAKLREDFGGKMEATYYFPAGSEYDGMIIQQLPDDVTAEALSLIVRGTGNFTKVHTMPVMNAEEFKAAMEKAKNVKSTYTAPTATKQ